MTQDVADLTAALVSVDSVSRNSNVEVSEVAQQALERAGFEVERLDRHDEAGELKVSLVGRKGGGAHSNGGLGLYSHSDTVPGDSWSDRAWTPRRDGDRLIGLGSCDMKGPLAATIVAGERFAAAQLGRPLLVAVTCDEEIGGLGAHTVAEESELHTRHLPRLGVVAEPTRLIPVYAHKSGGRVEVTAHGEAAHTSTGKGTSANYLIAPFLAEAAVLVKQLEADPSYHNNEFIPPHNCINMVLSDFGTRPNVTAAKTVATFSLRPMPGDRSADVVAALSDLARSHGLTVASSISEPFYVSPDSDVIAVARAATSVERAETVAFGTDSGHYKDKVELVILGPGNIEQAHTQDEWVSIAELNRAVDVYERMIQATCSSD
jgi:acetylornithine deacetylase